MSEDYILFDIPGDRRPTDAGFLERLGHRVMVCNGAETGQLCPLLSGAGCPLAEGAHGIVFELNLDRPQHRAILKEYKGSLRSDVPIRVVVRPGQSAKYADVLRGLKS